MRLVATTVLEHDQQSTVPDRYDYVRDQRSGDRGSARG